LERKVIGRTISHYKILEKLGEGGMGVVYKAQDLKLPRFVALKFLPPHLGAGPERKRFVHEAEAASTLEHPNICSIHEIDETQDGRMFIVMPCYEGESLEDKIKRGPLKLGEAVEIASQVASGLTKAHEKGIVHRDIKPGNIFLTKDGLAKIVDFGVAKLATRTRLTEEGKTTGTSLYMSPEQARGDEVDRRTDIWSLGATLYEMVTGRPPFRAEHEPAVIYSILNQTQEPVTALRTGVPMELERIIDKALAKSADDRYPHAEDFLVDLRRVKASLDAPASGTRPGAPPGKAARRKRWWPRLAVPGVIIIAVALVWHFRNPAEKTVVSERKMLAVLPFANLGPPDEEYFAAGITEEILSRLASIGELGVISRTSSMQYAGTDKTIKQIGDELGVDYILEGTVRWAQGSGGASRVRITPQLIRVSDDTHLWSEPYDRVISDIFEIQSDIAQRVVEHLGLTLLEKTHPALGAPPTKNLDAYQAYLKGQYYAGLPHFVKENWGKAVESYERAVELDPAFAVAYAKLSVAHARIYYYREDLSEARRLQAKKAVDRAVELAPDAREVHLALGYYHLFVERDVESAFKEFDLVAPDQLDDPEVLRARAEGWRQEGRWEEAIEYYIKACEIDPRNGSSWVDLGETCWWTRRYPEALDAFNKSIALSPDQMWPYLGKAFNYWSWKGKAGLAESRAVLEIMGPGYEPDWMAWSWMYQEIGEGRYQQALAQLDSTAGDWIRTKIGAWPKVLFAAQIHEYMGERAVAAEESAQAKDMLEPEVRAHPEDPRYHSSLGIAYAALGSRDEAIREGKRGKELLPLSKDAVYGIGFVVELAQIYMMVGDSNAALDEIENFLSHPGWVTPAFLEMDPAWNRLRGDPRYKQLIKKHSAAPL